MNPNPYAAPATEPHRQPGPASRDRFNAPELFGVLVRGIGLYFILSGVSELVLAIFIIGGHVDVAPGSDVWRYLRIAFEWGIPGGIAFFFPNFIVRLTYRFEATDESTDDGGGGSS